MGSAPAARTAAIALSERASARTSSPRARSTEMTRWPTNPEPPVTKTRIALLPLDVVAFYQGQERIQVTGALSSVPTPTA
jgi:hypothetical protein